MGGLGPGGHRMGGTGDVGGELSSKEVHLPRLLPEMWLMPHYLCPCTHEGITDWSGTALSHLWRSLQPVPSNVVLLQAAELL